MYKLMLLLLSLAQAPELGLGWMQEFDLATRQIMALAEATPEEKFSWRPGPGVRSVSEVYMHIALGNFGLLRVAGATLKTDISMLSNESEKNINKKAEVTSWLEKAAVEVRLQYSSMDRAKRVKFLGKDTTVDNVFLRILVHNHEHMGQSIAYAR